MASSGYEDRWNPKTPKSSGNQNFNPSVLVVAPVNEDDTETDSMSEQEVYITIKMLASFINRNGITANSISDLGRNVRNEMRRQNYHLATRSLATLLSLSGLSPPVEGNKIFSNLHQYMYQYFSIYLHDIEIQNPRHRCYRKECEPYCILPLYANRFMPDRKIRSLFRGLKEVLIRKPFLVSRAAETNEAETAQNLLKYLVSRGGCHSLEDSYDVLYTMSGHSSTIFDPQALVDSKLYELVFDHLRSYDYEKLTSRPRSIPWLSPGISELLTREIALLESKAFARNQARSLDAPHRSRITSSDSSCDNSMPETNSPQEPNRDETPELEEPIPQYRILRAISVDKNTIVNPTEPRVRDPPQQRQYGSEPAAPLTVRLPSSSEIPIPTAEQQPEPESLPMPQFRILRAISLSPSSDDPILAPNETGTGIRAEPSAPQLSPVADNSIQYLSGYSDSATDNVHVYHYGSGYRASGSELTPEISTPPNSEPQPEEPIDDSPPTPQYRILRAVPEPPLGLVASVSAHPSAPMLVPESDNVNSPDFTGRHSGSEQTFTEESRPPGPGFYVPNDEQEPQGTTDEDTASIPQYRILSAMPRPSSHRNVHEAPPSYETLGFPASSTSSDGDDQLPSYEQAMSGLVHQISLNDRKWN